MKVSRILSVAGLVTLLACGGAAFGQAPPVPVTAGVGVHRQPPGSRFRNPAHHRHPTTASRRASCSQQADAKGLQGNARKAFRSQCRRSGGR
jgi:hypothetical protein